MHTNSHGDTPRIAPYLLYEDVDAALEWLARSFGFSQRLRIPGPDGRTTHAEMSLADGVVMMGHPGPDYENPARHGHVCQLVYVYVDDVDAHFERAKAVGATILSEPEDKPYGDRIYSAEDLEGQRWFFAQHVRDVAPEDLTP
jgi:uncharacterized glyoxalase superfamily protein PhnB